MKETMIPAKYDLVTGRMADVLRYAEIPMTVDELVAHFKAHKYPTMACGVWLDEMKAVNKTGYLAWKVNGKWRQTTFNGILEKSDAAIKRLKEAHGILSEEEYKDRPTSVNIRIF